jgi:hypothetical protein
MSGRPAIDVGPIPGGDTTVVGPVPAPLRLPTPPRGIGVLPDLRTATDEDIADLAANAITRDDDLRALCGSPRHVLALCGVAEALDFELGRVEDALKVERDHFAEWEAIHYQTVALLAERTADARRLAKQVTVLIQDVKVLRAALDRQHPALETFDGEDVP